MNVWATLILILIPLLSAYLLSIFFYVPVLLSYHSFRKARRHILRVRMYILRIDGSSLLYLRSFVRLYLWVRGVYIRMGEKRFGGGSWSYVAMCTWIDEWMA